jgi:hypothetical protein
MDLLLLCGPEDRTPQSWTCGHLLAGLENLAHAFVIRHQRRLMRCRSYLLPSTLRCYMETWTFLTVGFKMW